LYFEAQQRSSHIQNNRVETPANKYVQSSSLEFYIHVTVHRSRFPFNNQLDALIIQIYSVKNSTCFRQLFCPSSGVLYCTIGTGKFHAGFDDRLQAFHPDFAWRRSSKPAWNLPVPIVQ